MRFQGKSAVVTGGAAGVTVYAVCPGLIDTEMVRANVSAERREA